MTTTIKTITEEKTNVLIFANYYVTLSNADGEEKNIHTVKGGYNPDNAFHAKALEAIKADPTRLQSRPTLSTGEKLYVTDGPQADAGDWS